jgi:hypothetical protein
VSGPLFERRWANMGSKFDAKAEELLVTAGGGGRSASRPRLGKVAVQGLADATGLRVKMTSRFGGPMAGTHSGFGREETPRRRSTVSRVILSKSRHEGRGESTVIPVFGVGL